MIAFHSHLSSAPHRRGTTLLEVLVATMVLLVLIGAVGLTVSSGTASYEQAMDAATVEARARRLVERIADELIEADRSTLSVTPPAPFGGTQVQFACVERVAGGAGVLGPARCVRVVFDPGELDDGLDNDGDGLVDERVVQFIPDLASPGRIVGWGGSVAEYLEGEVRNGLDDNGNGLVDEAGLCMTVDSETGTIVIRLTLEHDAPGQQRIIRTVETSVWARNE